MSLSKRFDKIEFQCIRNKEIRILLYENRINQFNKEECITEKTDSLFK